MKKSITLLLLLLATVAVQAAGRAVSYDWQGDHFEGYWTQPAEGAPLVLLIHDWDGLGDYEVKRAEMLAERGFAVFAADLYGYQVRPTTLEGKQAQSGRLYADRARMRTLMKAALGEAERLGANMEQAAAVGYCFGGSAVLELARSGEALDAFITFHGGLETPEGQDYSNVQGELLILHGTPDQFVTLDQFATLAAELESAGVTHEMITYSGAPHAFSVFGTERYREDADRKSWRRFTDFLEETLR